MNEQKTNPLGTEKISSLLLRFAIPSIIAMVVSALYNMVDQFFIGRSVGMLGNAATNVAFPLVITCTSIALMCGIGCAANFNLCMGRREKNEAASFAGNAITMLFSLGVILCIVTRLFLKPMMILFGATSSVLNYSLTYTGITSLGFPFLILTTGGTNLVRADGSPKFSMACTLTGAIINTILDPTLIFGFHMGISGAAIATVISQILSCIFAMTFLLGKKVPVKITFGQYNLKVIRKILSLGFSPFLILATDSLILIFMNTVLQKYGGASQGDMLITCATIAQSYLLLITSPMIGISGGTQAILSYNYGARCVNRVKDAERNILGVMLIFTTIMFLLSRFIPRYFVLLFTTDPQYIRFSVWVIRTYTLMIIPLSFQYVFVDGLTALECPKTGLALSVTRKSLFVISAAVLPSFFGAKAAFFAEPVADGISSVLSTIVFLLLINRHLDKRCRMDKKESL